MHFHKFSHGKWSNKEERISSGHCFSVCFGEARVQLKISLFLGQLISFPPLCMNFIYELKRESKARRLKYSTTSPYYLLGYSQVCFSSCVKPYLLLQSTMFITLRPDVLCLPTINKILNGLLFSFSSLHNSSNFLSHTRWGQWLRGKRTGQAISQRISASTQKRFSLHNI